MTTTTCEPETELDDPMIERLIGAYDRIVRTNHQMSPPPWDVMGDVAEADASEIVEEVLEHAQHCNLLDTGVLDLTADAYRRLYARVVQYQDDLGVAPRPAYRRGASMNDGVAR